MVYLYTHTHTHTHSQCVWNNLCFELWDSHHLQRFISTGCRHLKNKCENIHFLHYHTTLRTYIYTILYIIMYICTTIGKLVFYVERARGDGGGDVSRRELIDVIIIHVKMVIAARKLFKLYLRIVSPELDKIQSVVIIYLENTIEIQKYQNSYQNHVKYI